MCFFFYVCSWFLSFSLWKSDLFIKEGYHNLFNLCFHQLIFFSYNFVVILQLWGVYCWWTTCNSSLSMVYFAGNSSRLPELGTDQALKLKQLTVLTLAETNKVFLLHIWSHFLNPLADISGWFVAPRKRYIWLIWISL